ncbi:MAG: Ig-like domain-containing protein [Limisphaerales bacterium]
MFGRSLNRGCLLLVSALTGVNFIPCVRATPPPPLPFVSVQAAGPLASEPGGNPGMFAISRADGAASALTLSFTLGGTATNGVDYSEVPTNVTFAAGQTSTNIAIVPISEPQASQYKTVILKLRRDAVANPPALPSFIVGSMNRAVVYIVYNYTNVAPRVAWVTPSNGASFLSRPNVELAVNASDSNGWVTAVSFLANGQRVGAVTNSAFPGGWSQPLSSPETHGLPQPMSLESRREFQFVWTNIPPGIYALTAVATDNAGLQTTSDSVQITVTTNLPAPRVRIVNPPKGSHFPDSAAINIYAAAGESGGVVNTVEFLANGASLGVETNYFASQPSSQFHLSFQWLPYNFRWTNAPQGSNVLTVIATDNNGTMATSAPVAINVTTNTYHHHHN